MNCSINWVYEKKAYSKYGKDQNYYLQQKRLRKNLCGVGHKGVSSNWIFCDGCQSWIYKKCSDFKGRLKAAPKHRCKKYMRLCRPVYGRSEKYVTLEGIQLDKVESFRYLGDKICPGGVVT